MRGPAPTPCPPPPAFGGGGQGVGAEIHRVPTASISDQYLSPPLLLAPLLAACLSGCVPHSRPVGRISVPSPAAAGVRFADVTATAGIHFQHTSGRSGRFYLPETLGSGCA